MLIFTDVPKPYNTLLVSLMLHFIAAYQVMGPESPYHCLLCPNRLCLQCVMSMQTT